MSNTKGTQAEASRVQLDGLWRKLVGYDTGAQMGDQLPLAILSSGLTNLFGGASQDINDFLAPADYKAVAAYVNVNVDPGTAAATIAIGTNGAINSILKDYSIATNAATGFSNLTANAAFTAATQQTNSTPGGNQGDIIGFSTNGNATATGKAVWGCILVITG